MAAAFAAGVFGELEFSDLYGLWFGDFFDDYGLEAGWLVEFVAAFAASVFEGDNGFVRFWDWARASFVAGWPAEWFGWLVSRFPLRKTLLGGRRVRVFVKSETGLKRFNECLQFGDGLLELFYSLS